MDWWTHTDIRDSVAFLEACAPRWKAGQEFCGVITVKPFAAAVKAAGKPVTFLIGQGYNHFEMFETLGNPYGLLGRAMLEQMKLKTVCCVTYDGAPNHQLRTRCALKFLPIAVT